MGFEPYLSAAQGADNVTRRRLDKVPICYLRPKHALLAARGPSQYDLSLLESISVPIPTR